MKHYTRGQFTITFTLADGIAAAAVTAILSQLKARRSHRRPGR